MMIRTQNWLDSGKIPEEWVAIPREHFKAYIRAHNEVERLRALCASAAHWLILPPTTDSDRNIVINLSRKLKEAAEAGGDE